MKSSENLFLTGSEQCRGCGSLLAARMILKAIYQTDDGALVFGRSCGGGRSELQTGGRIAVDGSGLTGIQAALEARDALEDRTLVVMTGEGRALEMGAGDFLATFDRAQKLTWIILDNQAYANSGSAATALTPLGAATRIFSRVSGGKPTAEREMALMMIFGGARYVATATPAFQKDLTRKVVDALRFQPSYLHVYVPCQVSWMYRPENLIELSRGIVKSGLAPLWAYREGVFKRTVKVAKPSREHLSGFLGLQRRYAGITEQDVECILENILEKNMKIEALEKVFAEPAVSGKEKARKTPPEFLGDAR